MRVILTSLFVWCALAVAAVAHEVRPAYLELRETAPETYDVLWKVPAKGDMRLALYLRFPANALQLSEPRGMLSGGAHIERWRIQRPGGLDGQSIAIEGLSSLKIDTLVRVTDLKGITQTLRATPDAPSVTVTAAATGWQVMRTYTVLGFEHILLGIDHLLFFGLLHGLGFAGALSEVGLPQHAIPLALLFFNVGVELGQLAFIAAVLGFAALARRIPLPVPRWAPLLPPYAIGAVAMFWVIERTAAFR